MRERLLRLALRWNCMLWGHKVPSWPSPAGRPWECWQCGASVVVTDRDTEKLYPDW